MQLIVHLDAQGLVKVELLSASGETSGCELFLALRAQIEALGIAAQEVGREMEGGEGEAA